MKYLFLVIAGFLTVASFGVYVSAPDVRRDVPVIYWVTDNNPARTDQIALFEQWMREKGYPPVEMRLDASNNDLAKKIIQGVSGVAGDNLDLYSGGQFRFPQAVGLLMDVTEVAIERGFSPAETYPAVLSELTVPDPETGELRQYLFPCNVAMRMYWVNRATFEEYDQPPPPSRWTLDEFEKRGRAFVEAANPADGSRRHRIFFANRLDPEAMRRSMGLSVFNETMTRCVLDDPRQVAVLERMHQWIYVDRLIPSAADEASFATEVEFGGTGPQLFNSGRMAMMLSGRFMLIQLRGFNERRKELGQPLLDMSVVEPPHGGVPMVVSGSRGNAVYVGSDHPDLALRFLEFLSSEQYNMHIVQDGDALPPIPEYSRIEAFERPPDRPEEWDVHKPFADAIRDIAVSGAYSPFVLPSTAARLETEQQEAFLSGLVSASQAARRAEARINAAIQRTLAENPRLVPLYERLTARQDEIDRLRAAGEPVPLAWIENPVHRRYYQEMGWVE